MAPAPLHPSQKQRRPLGAQPLHQGKYILNRAVVMMLSVALLIIWVPISMALSRPPSAAGFVRPPPIVRHSSRNHGNTRSGRLFLSSNRKNDALSDECDFDGESVESSEHIIQSSSSSIETRRQFFQQQILASILFPTVTQAATDNSAPYAVSQQLLRQQKMQLQEQADKRKRSISFSKTKKWTPFVNVNKWDSVETCLLEMLPVRNPVFRRLQELIQDLRIFPAGDSEGWKQTLLDALTILSFLDSKRSILEPVFNQEDPTELYISKSSLGELNIEHLRSKLEDLITIASGAIDLDMNGRGLATVNSELGKAKSGRRRPIKQEENTIDDINMEGAGDIDTHAFIEAKRKALLALSELGELLVPSFPFSVPNRGKFGYLPRLLGRCSVTLSFERPSSPSSAFGINLGGIGGNDKQFLGNVTIIADGYAAPITAGNFVDLSVRNFYTGLSVKSMRKRLGVVPTSSDNVIVNDFTELKDNFDSALDEIYDENRMTTDVVLPILGSFQEGFYDPLTAKPRRIPLEVVALDGTSPTKSTLTYSSNYASLDDDMTDAGTTTYSALTSSSSSSPQRSFSSSTSSSSSNSTAATYSNLDPVLSFNIPGLVALNHPDRVSNGGSSEFFALPRRDVSTKQSKLLNGQYAPFGYIVSGSDVYQSLRPGDVIGATYVSEVGLLNLVKIRKNAFEGGEDAVVEENDGDEEK
mmetsp:Transcript_14617/g.26442  ORF Transcript_14617/g.26442 Transcript_14617/m.26442 type:complete len:699 (-) Transcript_14617:127-2223(-)